MSAADPVRDIAANRSAGKYSPVEQARRVAWAAGRLAFRLSPRPCFAFRRWLLRCFGARVGAHVHIYPSAHIYFPWHLSIGNWSSIGEWALVYNLGPVTIGERVTLSQRTHLCAGTHDHRDPAMTLLKPPIVIGDDAWVCADAFVGPGVEVGAGAVLGARAVAVRNVPPWSVAVGNPARVVRQRTPHGDPASPGQSHE